MDIYRNINLSPDMIREILQKSPFYRLKVYGGSMLPLIRHGEDIIVQRIDMDAIRVGDVVFFSLENQFLAHRVVLKMAKEGKVRAVKTKGDTLAYLDPVCREEEFIGLVTATVRKGKLSVLSGPGLRWFHLAMAILSSFGLYLGYPLIKLNEVLGRGRLPFYVHLLRAVCCGPPFFFALCCMPLVAILSRIRISKELKSYFMATTN